MGNHATITESEVKVNASGKSITYNGNTWIRKDVYDRANQSILDEQRVVRDLKDYVVYLQIKLNEAGVHWQVMNHE